MAEIDVSSLIKDLDGKLDSGRKRAAEALTRIAEKSDDAEQLERIAGALRDRGFIGELMKVYARYRELTLPAELRISRYTCELINAAEKRPHAAFRIIRELEKRGVPAIPVLMAALDKDTDYIGGCAKNALVGIAIEAKDRATVEEMIGKARDAQQRYLGYPQNEKTERKFVLLEDLLRMLRSVRDSKPLVGEEIRPAKEAGKAGGAAVVAIQKLARQPK